MSEFIFDDEINALAAIPLPDNAILFDVGCSYGEYTLEMAKIMNGRPFTVHAFEANPKLIGVEGDRFDKVPNLTYYLNNFAVTDRQGEVSFMVIDAPGNQAAEGCSSMWLRPEFITNKWPYVPMVVPANTLNNYIEKNNITHVDVMKMDIEGAELSALRGGTLLFVKEMVNIIQFEYNMTFRDAGIGMKDVIQLIKKYNYALGDFRGGKYILLDDDFIEDFGHHNYYLINKTYYETTIKK